MPPARHQPASSSWSAIKWHRRQQQQCHLHGGRLETHLSAASAANESDSEEARVGVGLGATRSERQSAPPSAGCWCFGDTLPKVINSIASHQPADSRTSSCDLLAPTPQPLQVQQIQNTRRGSDCSDWQRHWSITPPLLATNETTMTQTTKRATAAVAEQGQGEGAIRRKQHHLFANSWPVDCVVGHDRRQQHQRQQQRRRRRVVNCLGWRRRRRQQQQQQQFPPRADHKSSTSCWWLLFVVSLVLQLVVAFVSVETKMSNHWADGQPADKLKGGHGSVGSNNQAADHNYHRRHLQVQDTPPSGGGGGGDNNNTELQLQQQLVAADNNLPNSSGAIIPISPQASGQQQRRQQEQQRELRQREEDRSRGQRNHHKQVEVAALLRGKASLGGGAEANSSSSSRSRSRSRSRATAAGETISSKQLGQQLSPQEANDEVEEVQRIGLLPGDKNEPKRGRRRRSASAGAPSEQQAAAATARTMRKLPVINGILRGQVELACDVQAPELDDSVSLILWYKDNSMVPIYSVDARAAPVQVARHKPGAWLEGRSALRFVSEPQQQRQQKEQPNGGDEQQLAGASSRRRRAIWLPVGAGASDSNQENNYNNHEPAWPEVGHPPTAGQRAPALSPLGWWPRRRWQQPSEQVADQSPVRRRRHKSHDGDDRPSQAPVAESLVLERRNQQQQQHNHHHQMPRPPRLIAKLLIDSLSSEDNGIYRCRVDFRRARSRIEATELRIVVPPEKPVIRDLTSGGAGGAQSPAGPMVGQQQPIVGPYNEGARVVLECETSGGYPEPSLSWWRDGQLVDDTYELVSISDTGAGPQLERRRATFGADDAPPDGEQAPDPSGPAAAAAGDEAAALADRMGVAAGNSMHHHAGAPMAPLAPTTTTQYDTAAAAEAPRHQSVSPLTTTPTSQNRLVRNRLELGPIGRSDLLANYSCRAWSSKLGEPPSSFVMIDMNLRPLKVQIDNERQPVLADKQLEIVCRVYGSRPAPLVSWWRGQTQLLPTASANANANTNSQPDPRREPGGGAYGSSATSAAAAIQIQETISLDSNVTTSTLLVVPKLEDAGQLISCRAENTQATTAAAAATATPPTDQRQQQHAADDDDNLAPPPTSLADSWRLEVHYAPRVRLALGDKLLGRQVREGQDVYFECAVQAQPAAHELRWWFRGKELETNVSLGVIISNQSLVLQRVTRKQRGSYTCSALNQVGESRSNQVELRVQHAPQCLLATPSSTGGALAAQPNGSNKQGRPSLRGGARVKTNYGAARNEPVQVVCQVEADPSDSVQFKWAFVADGTPTRGGGGGSSEDENDSDQPRLIKQQQLSSELATSGNWSGQQLVYLEPSQYATMSPPSVGSQRHDGDDDDDDARDRDGDGDEQPRNRHHYRHQLAVSVATWTPRSELNYGTLLCWAQNALGAQLEPCAYRIVPAEPPEPVRNCRLMNSSDSQLIVACEPGYDNGVEQSFHMEVYELHGRELVANVTSSSSPSSPGPKLLASSAGSHPPTAAEQPSDRSGPFGANGSSSPHHRLPANNELDNLSSDSNSDANPESMDRPANDQAAAASQQQQQPASLISGDLAAAAAAVNNNKRHSSSSTSSLNNNNQQSASGASAKKTANTQRAIFATGAQLAPATDYLLTIYATNSRGSSKPIVFTATTKSDNSNQPAGSLAGARDGRRLLADHHQAAPAAATSIGQVFQALSWSPFLLVCAVTVLIFALFASVTFAMLKYVDLGGALWQPHQHQTATDRSRTQANGRAGCGHHDASSPSLSSKNSTTKSIMCHHHLFQQQQHQQAPTEVGSLTSSCRSTSMATDQQQQQQRLASGVEQVELVASGASSSCDLAPAALAAAATRGRGQQARAVVSIDSSTTVVAGGDPASSVSRHNSTNFQRSLRTRGSLVNGSYLKFKLQQISSASGAGSSDATDQQQQQQLILHNQLFNYSSSNNNNSNSRLKQSNSDNYLNESLASQFEQFHLEQHPVGAAADDDSNWFRQAKWPTAAPATATDDHSTGTLPRYIGGAGGGDAGAPLGHQRHHRALASSLMLAPAVGSQTQAGVTSAAGVANGTSGLLQPVEHLVISGQQYQVAPAAPPQVRHANGLHHHHHQPAWLHHNHSLGHQQHLQLTGAIKQQLANGADQTTSPSTGATDLQLLCRHAAAATASSNQLDPNGAAYASAMQQHQVDHHQARHHHFVDLDDDTASNLLEQQQRQQQMMLIEAAYGHQQQSAGIGEQQQHRYITNANTIDSSDGGLSSNSQAQSLNTTTTTPPTATATTTATTNGSPLSLFAAAPELLISNNNNCGPLINEQQSNLVKLQALMVGQQQRNNAGYQSSASSATTINSEQSGGQPAAIVGETAEFQAPPTLAGLNQYLDGCGNLIGVTTAAKKQRKRKNFAA